MDQMPGQPPQIEPPEGRYSVRLDDRGRAKLPVPFKEYLEKFENKRLFVTSLDRRIAQVYPIGLWKQTKKFLEEYSEDPAAAENLAFNAADLGAETEMDAQGRIVFGTDLRKELNLEMAQVHLYCFGGHIEVLTDDVYNERKKAAQSHPVEDFTKLRRAGLK
jgi:DNA-binding transcriptional regulator/RsmH inhibitor MraZ